MWKIGSTQHLLFSNNRLDSGIADDGQGMILQDRKRGRSGGRRYACQRTRIDCQSAAGHTQSFSERSQSYIEALLSLDQFVAGESQLCVGPRSIDSRPEIGFDHGMDRLSKNL